MSSLSRIVMKPFVWSTLVGGVLTFGTFGLAQLFTLVIGDYCWAPRIGGVLVGLSVFLQGYIWANPQQFQRTIHTGHTHEQVAIHAVYVVTLFGTLVWALGDFVPPLFGVPMCTGAA
jgi:hypothetical protein